MRTCSYRDEYGLVRCTECGQAMDICECEDPDASAGTRFNTKAGQLCDDVFKRLEIDQNTNLSCIAKSFSEVVQCLEDSKDIVQPALSLAEHALRICIED